ncbi:S8 family serine peptidase [Myxococcota bacterium]|nr:S8 family serine peptidase [Myxococcota bacterium]MBU1512377.1 S8 family serine peptidase [Myxococcota bacterium]
MKKLKRLHKEHTHTHRTNEFLLFMMAVFMMSACGDLEPRPDDPPSKMRDLLAPEAPVTTPEWRHPFTEGLQAEGIALYEAKVDAEGRPYAIVDQARQDPDGTVHQFSGVTTLDSEPMSEADLEEARRAEEVAPRVVDTAPKIGDRLLDEAIALEAGQAMPISIYLRRPADYTPLTQKLERSIALGEVSTLEERSSVRQRLLSEQQTLVAREMARARAAIEALGGRVTYQCRNLFCMEAELTAEQIFLLQDEPVVARMDAFEEIEENAIRGEEVAAGTQMQQFHDEDYLGDHNAGSLGRVKVGVTEWEWYRSTHYGFRDLAYPNTTTRIVKNRTCSSSSCANGTPSSFDDHATAVTGIALADLTEGQDPYVPTAWDRLWRSGFAREASIFFWRAETTSALVKVLDDVANDDISVLNMSISITGDTSCLGESTTSRAVNTLFEYGTLVIIAAGNGGHDSTSDCKVVEPGSAISAFVVGGHTNSATGEGESDVRAGNIFRYSSAYATTRGGCSLAEGKWRSIIDITAPACRAYVLNETGTYDYTYNQGLSCGTSFAAPTVTGAAANFIDYYRNERSSAIDDPGRLTANMLLMGDRQAEGFVATQGFSNLWGAGRMKMRKFDAAGMDSPSLYDEMVTCVPNGQNIYYPNSNGFYMQYGSSVNALKAVLYYYDWRHEQGTSIDRVSLALERKNQDGSWTVLNSDSGYYEEKKRVFYSSFYNNTYYRIRMQGQNVTTVSGFCGSNSIRVHLALFYESSARDDFDGPWGDIDTE